MEEEEPIASTSEQRRETAPVSPRKLPALRTELEPVKQPPAQRIETPLASLAGKATMPEEAVPQSDSLGARRFSARIAKLRAKRNEAKQHQAKEGATIPEKPSMIEEEAASEVAVPAARRVPVARRPEPKPVAVEERPPVDVESAPPHELPPVEAPSPKPTVIKRALKFDESSKGGQGVSEAGSSTQISVKFGVEPAKEKEASAKPSIPHDMIYIWDENTGTLKTLREKEGTGSPGPKTRYVEDAITGTFQKVTGKASLPKRAWGKAKKIRMGGNPLSLKLMYDTTSNIFGVCYLFLQGVLGGMSLISLYMFMLLDGSTPNGAFMRFYSPLSMAFSRTFFTLIVMSILGAYDKFHKDWTLNFEPVGPSQRTIDICLLVLYLVSLLCSVINTGYDDLMHYSYRRVPDWYELELSSDFKNGYSMWYALTMIKLMCCSLSWALVSFELRPK